MADTMQADRQELATNPVSRAWIGHSLVAADVINGPPETVIACLACGAFAWQRRGLLLHSCRGKALAGARQGQRQRFLAGIFPGARAWHLSQPRRMTDEEEAWLCRGGGKGVGARSSNEAATRSLVRSPFLVGPSLLQAFGLESSGDLLVWTRRAKCLAQVNSATGDEDEGIGSSWDALGTSDLEDGCSDEGG